jgi:hypothetical protein
MKYLVSAELETPAGAPELDPLQREGVGALLTDGLIQVDEVTGPDGIEVEVEDFRIGVHPAGAIVGIVTDAPALEFAEQAMREVIEQVLEHTELLTDWQVTKCEVSLNDELALESLRAAEGHTAPPNDPADRLTPPHRDTPKPGARDLQEQSGQVRAQILRAAEKLRAFDLTAFGHYPDEPDLGLSTDRARLAAGALLYSVETMLDHLFEDIQTLRTDRATVAEGDGFFVMDDLPAQYAHKYTALLAQQFLVAAVTITGRLLEPQWHKPSCVAEALALHLLIEEAKGTLDIYDLLDGQTAAEAYAAFQDHAYEDLDFEWLYDPSFDGIDQDPSLDHLDIRPMDVGSWFLPYPTATRPLHPYAENKPPTERTEWDD